MKNTGFYVWCPDGEKPSFQHDFFDSAVREAERLAGIHRGKEFVVLRALGSSLFEEPGKFKPTYNLVDQDGIPF